MCMYIYKTIYEYIYIYIYILYINVHINTQKKEHIYQLSMNYFQYEYDMEC